MTVGRVTLDVIGAGVGRTDTLSCMTALEQLGFGPCSHVVEVYEIEGHIDAWADAINRAPLDVARIFAGCRSAVAWPAWSFWKQLLAAPPGRASSSRGAIPTRGTTACRTPCSSRCASTATTESACAGASRRAT